MQFTIEDDFPPHPQCFRSVCEGCGVGTRQGVRALNVSSINIDHEDGFYTSLFLCELCVTEWARALGMLDQRDSEAVVAESVDLEQQVADLREELESLKAVRAAIRRVIEVDHLDVPEWLAEVAAK